MLNLDRIGCTENVVSSAIVNTLKLPTTKHPKPYKIDWLHKGIGIVITEKLTFSIEKHYVCEILCNVIDMDVCHHILGRP